jgi:hypothetical protein
MFLFIFLSRSQFHRADVDFATGFHWLLNLGLARTWSFIFILCAKCCARFAAHVFFLPTEFCFPLGRQEAWQGFSLSRLAHRLIHLFVPLMPGVVCLAPPIFVLGHVLHIPSPESLVLPVGAARAHLPARELSFSFHAESLLFLTDFLFPLASLCAPVKFWFPSPVLRIHAPGLALLCTSPGLRFAP